MLAIPVAMFGLILASAPFGSGWVRRVWVLASLAFTAWVALRVKRMAVEANEEGLTVTNFGRRYVIPWSDAAVISCGPSDNVTGAVSTISISQRDGTVMVARAASSYSRPRVEEWTRTLNAARPCDGTVKS